MRRNTRTRYRSQFFPRWGCLVRSSCVPTVIVKNSDTNIVARRVQGELKCRTSFSLLTSLRREIIVHPWELPWKMKSETRMLLCFRSSLNLTAVVNVNWIENSFSRTLFRERVEFRRRTTAITAKQFKQSCKYVLCLPIPHEESLTVDTSAVY